MNIKFNPYKPVNITFGEPKQHAKRPELTTDVFVKTTKPAEKSSNDFIKWANENDFLLGSLPTMLLNEEETEIGRGFTHKTYAIPGNDDYILRTANYNDFRDVDYSTVKLIDTEDKNLKLNVGQQVALINLQDHQGMPMSIEVLKKQTGKPIGNPPAEVLYDERTRELKEGATPYEASERKEHYAESLSKLAQLPVESYEKLISDVTEAAKAGYSFDHLNSNNLLLDEKNESINLIDMDKNKLGVNYGNLIYAITNINYFDTYKAQHGENPVSPGKVGLAIDDTVHIVQKYMLAMRNQGVKFDRKSQTFEFDKFMRSLPVSAMCGSFDIQDKWKYFEQNGVA